jgi:hypothetical protein
MKFNKKETDDPSVSYFSIKLEPQQSFPQAVGGEQIHSDPEWQNGNHNINPSALQTTISPLAEGLSAVYSK